jgi:hypothetical protein
VADVRRGAVLDLADADWLYGDGPLTLIVREVRRDLSRDFNGEWLWIEGCRPTCGDEHAHCLRALVRTGALP